MRWVPPHDERSKRRKGNIFPGLAGDCSLFFAVISHIPRHTWITISNLESLGTWYVRTLSCTSKDLLDHSCLFSRL